MDSFQATIGWNSLRNRENNNYRSVPFRSNPTGNRNSKKIAKKLKSTISSHNSQEKDEKQRKQKLSFSFVPTRCVIENSKKITKKQKKNN